MNNKEFREVHTLVDDATSALNFLHGERSRPVATRAPAGSFKRKISQQLTQQHFQRSARRWVGCRGALEPQEALTGLLRGRSPYGAAQSTANLASFSSRLTLPADLASGPFVADTLDVHASNQLKCFTTEMLRPSAEYKAAASLHPVVGYTDPILKSNRRIYLQLVRRALDCGLVELMDASKCVIGLFFVWKKNGKIRLILDCRASNQYFKDPPSVDLLTSEGLSNIELNQNSADFEPDEHVQIDIGVADVSGCFNLFRLRASEDGEDIRLYFSCPPPVFARELRLREFRGKPIDPDA